MSRAGALRSLLLFTWVLGLVLAALLVQRTLRIGADLRLFMPPPQNAQERLLMEGIAAGPAARLVLVGLEGAEPQTLTRASARLAEALRSSPGVVRVLNGDGSERLDVPETLLPLRYLLADAQLDAAALSSALRERREDLASTMAPLVEEWLPRDPLLLTLGLVERWTAEATPTLRDGVWFSRDGARALQVVELDLEGFDPQAQGAGLSALHAALLNCGLPLGVQVDFSGPAVFSAYMRARTESEAGLIGMVDTVGLATLLFFAYRRWQWVIAGALPLATAGVAGLATVGLLFGEAHGITLAFGFTLIGVAQDYPLHLFSHLYPGADPRTVVRQIWPTLVTGVASTCVAYLAFVLSGVAGLAQLGCFTIAGLAAAAITTRWLLPAVLPEARWDPAGSRHLRAAWRRIESLPRPTAAGLTIVGVLALAAVAFGPTPLWQDSLAALTPVPPELLARDRQLRQDLATPDLRYLFALEAGSEEEALRASEALEPDLRAWQDRGLLADYDIASRYLPSSAHQRERQEALPARETLAARISTAALEQGFEPASFEPFLADVEAARKARPLSRADLAETPLQARVDSLLMERTGQWTAIVTLTGVNDPAALAAAGAERGIRLLDLKIASESLVARQRGHIIQLLGAAAVLLVFIVFVALRRPERVWRAVAPMSLSTLLVMAILQCFGVPLNLFHLVSLVLAAGLGLDYAMFFERPSIDDHEQIRTLHGVLACTATTLLVFSLLAFSSLPVLQGIGVTVALGAALNFVLALLVSRPYYDTGPTIEGA